MKRKDCFEGSFSDGIEWVACHDMQQGIMAEVLHCVFGGLSSQQRFDRFGCCVAYLE